MITTHRLRPMLHSNWSSKTTTLLFFFLLTCLSKCQYCKATSNSWCGTTTTAFAGFGSSSKKVSKKKEKKSGGGGFGSSGGGATSSSSSSSKKKKRKGNLLSSDIAPPPPPPSPTPPAPEEPKLDRFGLPIATEDTIFPPLPPDTELIPATTSSQMKETTTTTTILEEIRDATKDHLGIDYSYFDEFGVEKTTERETRMKLKLLHKSPPVLAIENFFTPNECTECLSLATPTTTLNQNLKINSATFSTLAQSKRTSTTWFCHYSQLPSLLAKTTKLLSVPLEQLEEPQVVRYKTGQQFSWHYDEIPASQLENGGQRVATLLVYLNTLDQGGATIFRDLKSPSGEQLAMQPKKGSALLFFPAFKDGTPDDRTLHKGEVAIDEKMIAQIWIHEGKYQPVVPEGNSHEEALGVLEEKYREMGYSS